jgi:hypothetical protein
LARHDAILNPRLAAVELARLVPILARRRNSIGFVRRVSLSKGSRRKQDLTSSSVSYFPADFCLRLCDGETGFRSGKIDVSLYSIQHRRARADGRKTFDWR